MKRNLLIALLTIACHFGFLFIFASIRILTNPEALTRGVVIMCNIFAAIASVILVLEVTL